MLERKNKTSIMHKLNLLCGLSIGTLSLMPISVYGAEAWKFTTSAGGSTQTSSSQNGGAYSIADSNVSAIEWSGTQINAFADAMSLTNALTPSVSNVTNSANATANANVMASGEALWINTTTGNPGNTWNITSGVTATNIIFYGAYANAIGSVNTDWNTYFDSTGSASSSGNVLGAFAANPSEGLPGYCQANSPNANPSGMSYFPYQYTNSGVYSSLSDLSQSTLDRGGFYCYAGGSLVWGANVSGGSGYYVETIHFTADSFKSYQTARYNFTGMEIGINTVQTSASSECHNPSSGSGIGNSTSLSCGNISNSLYLSN